MKYSKLINEFFSVANELIECNERNSYNLRSRSDFSLPIAKTVFGGLDTLSYLGSEIWEIVALEIKVVAPLLQMKKKVRLWNPTNWSSRICKRYIHNLRSMQRFIRRKSTDMLVLGKFFCFVFFYLVGCFMKKNESN